MPEKSEGEEEEEEQEEEEEEERGFMAELASVTLIEVREAGLETEERAVVSQTPVGI